MGAVLAEERDSGAVVPAGAWAASGAADWVEDLPGADWAEDLLEAGSPGATSPEEDLPVDSSPAERSQEMVSQEVPTASPEGPVRRLA